MRQALKCGCIGFLLALICVVDCSASKKQKIPPDPKFAAIENISVLPIVDDRAGDKANVNMGNLQRNVVKALQKKHYSVTAADTTGDAVQIAVEDLEDAHPPYLKKLGPTNQRWVMVVLLDDVHSKITFGSTGNAEVSGYLFDKDSGELLWKGKGVGQAGQGGLMGMTMKGMMKGEALSAAVANLLSSVPTRPKPGKS